MDKQVAYDNEIIRVVNGSRLYGTFTEESDNDYIAVFVEPPDIVFSKSKVETVPLHSRCSQERASTDETDGQAYSLRHFISLVAAGNPSLLTTLYAPPKFWELSTRQGETLFSNPEIFASMEAAPRFEGYMLSQLKRLQGVKVGHVPNRPWLVEKYGYDTKYAGAVARLALQGVEFFRTGRIESPMSTPDINLIMAIKCGKFSYDEVITLLETLQITLEEEISLSNLPAHPERDRINKLSRDLHESWWRDNSL